MVPNGKGCHYLVITKLSALLKGITSKYHSHFYCLNCLHSFTTGNMLKSHEKVCKNVEFCVIVLPTKIIHLINKLSQIKCLILLMLTLNLWLKKYVIIKIIQKNI